MEFKPGYRTTFFSLLIILLSTDVHSISESGGLGSQGRAPSVWKFVRLIRPESPRLQPDQIRDRDDWLRGARKNRGLVSTMEIHSSGTSCSTDRKVFLPGGKAGQGSIGLVFGCARINIRQAKALPA